MTDEERIYLSPGTFVINHRRALRRAAEVLRAWLVDPEGKQPDTRLMTDPDSPLHRPTWCVEHGPHGEHRNTFGQVTLTQPLGGEPQITIIGPTHTPVSGSAGGPTVYLTQPAWPDLQRGHRGVEAVTPEPSRMGPARRDQRAGETIEIDGYEFTLGEDVMAGDPLMVRSSDGRLVRWTP